MEDKSAIFDALERRKAYILEVQQIFGDFEYEPLKPGLGEVPSSIRCRCISRHEKIEMAWLAKVEKVLGTISDKKLRRRAIPLARIPGLIKQDRNPSTRWEKQRLLAESRAIKKYEQ